jgi:hypothetical protein
LAVGAIKSGMVRWWEAGVRGVRNVPKIESEALKEIKLLEILGG